MRVSSFPGGEIEYTDDCSGPKHEALLQRYGAALQTHSPSPIRWRLSSTGFCNVLSISLEPNRIWTDGSIVNSSPSFLSWLKEAILLNSFEAFRGDPFEVWCFSSIKDFDGEPYLRIRAWNTLVNTNGCIIAYSDTITRDDAIHIANVIDQTPINGIICAEVVEEVLCMHMLHGGVQLFPRNPFTRIENENSFGSIGHKLLYNGTRKIRFLFYSYSMEVVHEIGPLPIKPVNLAFTDYIVRNMIPYVLVSLTTTMLSSGIIILLMNSIFGVPIISIITLVVVLIFAFVNFRLWDKKSRHAIILTYNE